METKQAFGFGVKGCPGSVVVSGRHPVIEFGMQSLAVLFDWIIIVGDV